MTTDEVKTCRIGQPVLVASFVSAGYLKVGSRNKVLIRTELPERARAFCVGHTVLYTGTYQPTKDETEPGSLINLEGHTVMRVRLTPRGKELKALPDDVEVETIMSQAERPTRHS